MAKNRRQNPDDHTHIAIAVKKHDEHLGTGFNLDLVAGIPFRGEPGSLVFESRSSLRLHGVAIYPDSRANEEFEVQLYGDRRKALTLDDIRVYDQDRTPLNKASRGVEYPVYKRPSGLAVIERHRNDEPWRTCVFVEPRMISDMLVLLAQARPYYLAIHELKAERRRWLQGISLQTTNPAEE